MAIFDLFEELNDFVEFEAKSQIYENIVGEWKLPASHMYHFTRRALDKNYIPDKNKICNPTYYLNSNGEIDINLYLLYLDDEINSNRQFCKENPLGQHSTGYKNGEFWNIIDKFKIKY
ncbi:hypothetical protein [Spiroplasma culicicola]|uniref:Uncharacterized protein n=1 Tax=Spiroplasma culicicola AES-1 TaxID=1276246 RepID=W6A7H0_9MOLU|nr:hypothetical protein [Spiroplasma culicicola]AHI52932.1 hypothetical protein SCULI_v1c05910 [Spiroplasma culicicola AES-1]